MKKTGFTAVRLQRPFHLLWLGDSISQLGATLVSFAMGVWIFQQTRSVTAFGNAVLSATLPAMLVLPFAGGLADRIGRKQVIVAVDCTLAAMTIALMILLQFGELRAIHLYVFNSVASAVGALRLPAYQSSVSSMVSQDGLGRATGLLGVSEKILGLTAPLLASLILELSGMRTVLGINVLVLFLGSLLIIRAFVHLEQKAKVSARMEHSLGKAVLRSIKDAIRFFRNEPLMLGLLVYSILQTSLLTLCSVMLTPLVLANNGPAKLGIIYTSAAFGSLAGLSLLIFFRNPRRMMLLAICADCVLSISVLAIGFTVSVPGYCALAFIGLAAGSLAEGCNSTIWMRKVPDQDRTSVLAFVKMLMIGTMAIVVSGGGILVDRYIAPAMLPGGALRQLFDNGPDLGAGRGIALLFFVSGVISMVLCISSFAYSGTRRLDLLVPDALDR